MRAIKNKQDPRFINTEKKIDQTFIAFLDRGDCNICVRDLCREINIFYSTFYDHYPNADAVLESIERKLKNTFLDSVSQDMPLKMILQKLLIFISKNQNYFKMTCKLQHYQLWIAILEGLHGPLAGNWRPRKPQILDRWFGMLCGELIAVLSNWGVQNDFDLKNAPVVQRRLEKLITTAEARFRQLENMR